MEFISSLESGLGYDSFFFPKAYSRKCGVPGPSLWGERTPFLPIARSVAEMSAMTLAHLLVAVEN